MEHLHAILCKKLDYEISKKSKVLLGDGFYVVYREVSSGNKIFDFNGRELQKIDLLFVTNVFIVGQFVIIENLIGNGYYLYYIYHPATQRTQLLDTSEFKGEYVIKREGFDPYIRIRRPDCTSTSIHEICEISREDLSLKTVTYIVSERYRPKYHGVIGDSIFYSTSIHDIKSDMVTKEDLVVKPFCSYPFDVLLAQNRLIKVYSRVLHVYHGENLTLLEKYSIDAQRIFSLGDHYLLEGYANKWTVYNKRWKLVHTFQITFGDAVDTNGEYISIHSKDSNTLMILRLERTLDFLIPRRNYDVFWTME